jgi:hypothetical protein
MLNPMSRLGADSTTTVVTMVSVGLEVTARSPGCPVNHREATGSRRA